MTEAEEDLIYEFGEWQLTATDAPMFEGYYSMRIKWVFVFNKEILN